MARLGATSATRLDRPFNKFDCRASCKKVRQTHPSFLFCPSATFFKPLVIVSFFIALGAFDAELSEIIMEIKDLRELAHNPDRLKQDRRRFSLIAHRWPLALYPNVKERTSAVAQHVDNTILIWERKS